MSHFANEKKTESVAFDQHECLQKVCPLQSFLTLRSSPRTHFGKHPNDGGSGINAGCATAENPADNEANRCHCGHILSKTYCVCLDISRIRTSSKQRSVAYTCVLCSVENKLHDIISGHSVLSDHPFDVCLAFSCRDVHPPPCVSTAPAPDSSPQPRTDKIQLACILCSMKNRETPPKHLSYRREKLIMRSSSSAAKEISNNVPAINMDSNCESLKLKLCNCCFFYWL